MKYLPILFTLFAVSLQPLFSAPGMLAPSADAKIGMDNQLLTKVNDRVISLVDVVKKMDMVLHRNYPEYANSAQARYQFYSTNWRHFMMEIIDSELMLMDAKEREVKLQDGEVREELEGRFGPNVIATLSKLGLTYEEAWKMIHDELIVRRMNWFFVHSKALQAVSPQDIRLAYRDYLGKHPGYQEVKYRVITIRPEEKNTELVKEVHDILAKSQKSPETCIELTNWEKDHPNVKIQISSEYLAKTTELSESYRSSLKELPIGCYSEPTAQAVRDNSEVYRLFYLAERTDHSAPAFEEMSNKIKDELTGKIVAQETAGYLEKLRQRYGFDTTRLKTVVPEDLKPFHLQ